MSTSLKRHLGILVTGAMLSLVILAAMLPGMAEAQSESPNAPLEQDTQNEDSTVAPSIPLVVHAGDSLWSITQQRLGHNATPAQIADEVERIFELNRQQIGEDPNLILAGQELLVPAVVSNNPSPSEDLTALEEPTPSELVVHEPIVDSDVPPNAPMDEEALPDEPTGEEALSDTPTNEDAVSEAPTEEQSAPAAASFVESLLGAYNNFSGRLNERQLLGLGILALTLIVAVLMVWRLPMRRTIEHPTASRVSRGYYDYENHAPPGNAPPEDAPLEDVEEQKDMPDPASEPFKARRELNSNSVRLEDAVPLSARGKERLRRGITLRRMRQRKHSPSWRE